MPQFTDKAGRQYEAVVTVQTAIELKKLGVDINDLASGELLQQLDANPELMVQTLWITVEDSALAHKLTPAEIAKLKRDAADADIPQSLTPELFVRVLDGDTLAAATDAMLEAFVSFSRPSVRAALQQLLAKGREVEALASQTVEHKLQGLTAEMVLTSLSTASSTPASLESIPAPSPSAS